MNKCEVYIIVSLFTLWACLIAYCVVNLLSLFM